jgi:hypothetical protein
VSTSWPPARRSAARGRRADRAHLAVDDLEVLGRDLELGAATFSSRSRASAAARSIARPNV